MSYTKFSFKVFRGTGLNTMFYFMTFSVLFPAIMICVFSIMNDTGDSSPLPLMIGVFAGVLPISLIELINRHPVFNGAEMGEKKPLITFKRQADMIHLLPFSREEIVRSFVKCSLFSEVITLIPLMFFSVSAIMQSFSTAVAIAGSLAFMWAAWVTAHMNRSLAQYNMIKVVGAERFSVIILLLATTSDDIIGSSDFNMPVVSVIFGAATILAAVISAVSVAKSQAQLISDCKNRSASGEAIGSEA